MAAVDGQILSIESSGQLMRTGGTTGDSVKLGPPQWTSTRIWVAAGKSIFSIDNDGSLYQVSVKDGKWQRIGAAGGFASVRQAAASSGFLYGLTSGGQLLKINLQTGASSKIGKPEWSATRLMMAGNALYVIDKQDTLYRVRTDTGAWIGVGKPGAWKATPAATVVGHKIYSVDAQGAMWETNGETGVYKKLKSPVFKGAERLFTDGLTVFIVYGGGLMERMRL